MSLVGEQHIVEGGRLAACLRSEGVTLCEHYCSKSLNSNLSVTCDNLKPFRKFEAPVCNAQNYYIWGARQRAAARNVF